MAHKFNPKNIHKLDNEKRRKSMPPIETLKKMLLKEGETIADIGCGIGYFSIPAATIVGENGHVYAVDVSKDMLTEFKKRVKGNYENIKILLSNEYNAEISDNTIDYLFLSNIFHEINDKDRFLKEYLRSLKSDGKIAFIEWKKIKTEAGPPYSDRLSESELTDILKENNIKVIKLIDIGENHYGLIGQRIQ